MENMDEESRFRKNENQGSDSSQNIRLQQYTNDMKNWCEKMVTESQLMLGVVRDFLPVDKTGVIGNLSQILDVESQEVEANLFSQAQSAEMLMDSKHVSSEYSDKKRICTSDVESMSRKKSNRETLGIDVAFHYKEKNGKKRDTKTEKNFEKRRICRRNDVELMSRDQSNRGTLSLDIAPHSIERNGEWRGRKTESGYFRRKQKKSEARNRVSRKQEHTVPPEAYLYCKKARDIINMLLEPSSKSSKIKVIQQLKNDKTLLSIFLREKCKMGLLKIPIIRRKGKKESSAEIDIIPEQSRFVNSDVKEVHYSENMASRKPISKNSDNWFSIASGAPDREESRQCNRRNETQTIPSHNVNSYNGLDRTICSYSDRETISRYPLVNRKFQRPSIYTPFPEEYIAEKTDVSNGNMDHMRRRAGEKGNAYMQSYLNIVQEKPEEVHIQSDSFNSTHSTANSFTFLVNSIQNSFNGGTSTDTNDQVSDIAGPDTVTENFIREENYYTQITDTSRENLLDRGHNSFKSVEGSIPSYIPMNQALRSEATNGLPPSASLSNMLDHEIPWYSYCDTNYM